MSKLLKFTVVSKHPGIQIIDRIIYFMFY